MTTVLLLDGNIVHRRVIIHILRPHGCTVVPAADEVEALEQLARHVCSFVIIDAPHPMTEGLALLRRIRVQYALRFLPILIITDSGREAEYQRMLEAGASAVLPRPFSIAELRGVVQLLVTEPLSPFLPVQIPASAVRYVAHEHLHPAEPYQHAS